MTALAGTPTLLRLALRRDRIALPAWVYLLAAMIASTAFSFQKLYGTPSARSGFAAGIASNSSLRALYGPLYDGSTIGGLTAWRVGVFGAVLAGLMSSLLVVRHTRAEEEDGRLELIGAGAVGRRAPLTAALLTALTANLMVALAVAGLLLATGQQAAGALAFGCSLAGCGLFFAALAAVTAQLSETARAANGLAGAVLGLCYALRALGDSGPGWVSWLSPIGWTEQVRAFAGDRWWVLLLPLAFAAALVAAAHTLVEHRDLGSGLLPQRPGRAAGPPSLRTAAALAVRLQRGSLLGWAVGYAVAGAVFGGVAKGVLDLVNGNSQLADLMARMGGRQGLLDSYLATIVNLFGMVAAGYAVQAVLRLRAEETSGRAEPVLAGAVSRLRWAAGHLLFPLLGTALLLALFGLAAGLAEGAVLGGVGSAVGRVVTAALVQLPAVWLVAAVAVALFGLLPRWSTAAWGVLAAFLLIGWLGPIVQAAQWVLDLSPFTHTPHLPGGPVPAEPLLWLSAVAAALTATGLASLRRRDLG